MNSMDQNNYQIDNQIGMGSSGNVYIGRDGANNIKAIKKINLAWEDVKCVLELDILTRISHPNLLSAQDFYFTDDDHLCYVTELYKTDIKEYVENNDLNSLLKKRLMFQIATALQVLHKQDICHRDIRLRNIMIDDNCTPILIDFGHAKTVTQERAEEVNGKKIRQNFKRSDIFNLACVFIFILTGEDILWSDDARELNEVVTSLGKDPVGFLKKYNISEEYNDIKDLIVRMIKYENICIETIIKDPIFSDCETVEEIIKIPEMKVISIDSQDLEDINKPVSWIVETCCSSDFPSYVLFSAVDLYYRCCSCSNKHLYKYSIIAMVCLRLSIKLLIPNQICFVNNHDAHRRPERYCLKLLKGILLIPNYYTVSTTMNQLICALPIIHDYNKYICTTPREFISKKENTDKEMLLGCDKNCGTEQLYLNYSHQK